MPSFLSKVFGKKKDEKTSPQAGGRASYGSLLDGKFEAVSPTVSASAAEFPENANGGSYGKERGREKEGAFGLFKVKSRPSSPERRPKKDELPPLSLVLPAPKEDVQARALGVVFAADPDSQILTDVVIGNKRLTPLEALILVRICSQAITARGLETLGLMRPHWYSASPDIQRKLISLFIHSLDPKASITALSPTPSPPTSFFESEVNYTRSPHDIAAVFRWALRHLELTGGSFGKEKNWYQAFSEAERKSGYPSKAYSEQFNPLVPTSHLELLNTTLELFSSLAAHSEKNSTSCSKLTRASGLWLLEAQPSEENDDWPKFYARWERAGRMLEHLFLAKIRDQALRVRMPTRLLELVAQYPYAKGATTEDDVFLRPRLSTRQYDALFVRVESEFSSPSDKVKRHPLQFVSDAFSAEATTTHGNDCAELWEKIRKAASDGSAASPGGYAGLGVFTDETISNLTLIPGDHLLKEATSPSSITEVVLGTPGSRRYASSPGERNKSPNGTSNGHIKPATDPHPLPSSPASPLGTDWVQFSSAGFSEVSASIAPLASTLFGQDVEKTNPRSLKPRKREKASRSPSANAGRESLEAPRTTVVEASEPKPEPPKLVSKSTPVSITQIDEAFIDFWTDAMLDPITSNWPTFVLCKLKPSIPDLQIGEKRIEYLVVEHVFVHKPQLPVSATIEKSETATTFEKLSVSSPKSSIKSEKRFFGFLTSSGRGRSSPAVEKVSATTSKNRKKVSPNAKVSELGEVLKEEDEKPTTVVKLRIPSPKPRKSADVSRASADIRKSVDVSRKSTDAPKGTDIAKGAGEAKLTGQVLVTSAVATIPVITTAAAPQEKDDQLVEPKAAATVVDDIPKAVESALPTAASEERPPDFKPEASPSVLQEQAPQQTDLVPTTETDVSSPPIDVVKATVASIPEPVAAPLLAEGASSVEQATTPEAKETVPRLPEENVKDEEPPVAAIVAEAVVEQDVQEPVGVPATAEGPVVEEVVELVEEPVAEEVVELAVEEPVAHEVVELAVEEPAAEEVVEVDIQAPLADSTPAKDIVELSAEEPVAEEIVESAVEEPAAEVAAESAEEPIAEEVAKSVVEEPAADDIVESAIPEPLAVPAAAEEPVAGEVVEATVEEPVVEEVAESVEEPVAEEIVQSAVEEPVAEVVAESAVEEPVAEMVADSVVEEPAAEHTVESSIPEPQAVPAAAEEPVAEEVVELDVQGPAAEEIVEQSAEESFAEEIAEPATEEPVAEETAESVAEEVVESNVEEPIVEEVAESAAEEPVTHVLVAEEPLADGLEESPIQEPSTEEVVEESAVQDPIAPPATVEDPAAEEEPAVEELATPVDYAPVEEEVPTSSIQDLSVTTTSEESSTAVETPTPVDAEDEETPNVPPTSEHQATSPETQEPELPAQQATEPAPEIPVAEHPIEPEQDEDTREEQLSHVEIPTTQSAADTPPSPVPETETALAEPDSLTSPNDADLKEEPPAALDQSASAPESETANGNGYHTTATDKAAVEDSTPSILDQSSAPEIPPDEALVRSD